ncbi:MAG: CPBP family intramembrane metalloprotease [Planctomycetes bacterium]|nr:CPBP family intramembrane metalloprotease [Planctomycetota bacterium]
MTDAPRRRLSQLTELLALFVVAPLLLWFARRYGVHVPIIPAVLLLGFLAWTHLRAQPDFDRRGMWRWPRGRTAWRPLLVRFAIGATLLTAYVALCEPDRLLSFPRRRPALWLLVMFGYPCLSVLPQELAYRAFFFHRYRALLPDDRARVLASALAFGHVHVVFGHWQSVALSTVGGLLFSASYLRTRSIWSAWAEHALYGCCLFTVGLGSWFYGGAALAP